MEKTKMEVKKDMTMTARQKQLVVAVFAGIVALSVYPTHGVGDVASAEPSPAPLSVSFYRLRLELSTTGQGARIIAEETENFLTARLMGVTGNPARQGVNMRSVWVGQDTGGNQIGVTADYAVTPDALNKPIPFVFEKRGEGSSVLQVFNVLGEKKELIQETHHTGANRLEFSLDLSALKNSPPLSQEVQRIESQKMLWAFYYQWYYVPWDTGILQDQPQIGYYNSDDRAVIARHIEQAQRAGIDGFIASWWGPPGPRATTTPLDLLLDAARERNFSVMIDFETVDFNPQTWEATPRDETTLYKWLKYAISNYGSHPAYMKVDGKPVFVIYSSALVPDATWKNVFTQLRTEGCDAVFLAEFGGEWPGLGDLDLFDGLHTYNILNIVQSSDLVPTILAQTYETTGRAVHYYPLLAESSKPKIWAATAQPGFDDHLIPGRRSPTLPRENGALYRSTFDAALKSDPDWIFLTTWNEWWEHTYIEPSVSFDTQYLQTTLEYKNRWESKE